MVPTGPYIQNPTASSVETPAGDLPGGAAAFIELGKPRVAGLVIVTSLCGALTAPQPIGLPKLLLSLAATCAVVASANGLNMWLERDTDALMRRTRSRPLPTGRLTPRQALWFCGISAVVGLSLLFFFVGALAALLCATALVSYVAAYTPMKRVSPLALFVGAVPGAIPPLIGWASATGTLSVFACLMFAILFVWQLPHFLAIAIFRRDEYARAGMRVLPVARSVRRTKVEIAIYTWLLVAVSLLPVGVGLAGIGYAVVAIASGLGFLALATAGLSVRDDNRWARRVFFASMPYLVIVLGALAIFTTR